MLRDQRGVFTEGNRRKEGEGFNFTHNNAKYSARLRSSSSASWQRQTGEQFAFKCERKCGYQYSIKIKLEIMNGVSMYGVGGDTVYRHPNPLVGTTFNLL